MDPNEFFKRYQYDIRTDKVEGEGRSAIYKAYDRLTQHTVLIKVSPVTTDEQGNTVSLRDEFEILHMLPRHRNIANYEALHTFNTPHGLFDFAVLPCLYNKSLAEVLTEDLSCEQRSRLASELLEAIRFLHAHRLLHCDLNTNNIRVIKNNHELIPVIVFGFGQGSETEALRYHSPEYLGEQPLRYNTDLWSYGVIVYEIMTGEPLFDITDAHTPDEAREMLLLQIDENRFVSRLHNIESPWNEVLKRCMVVDAAYRAQNSQELLALLDASAILPSAAELTPFIEEFPTIKVPTPAIDEEPTTETIDEEEKTPAIDEEPTTETVDEEEETPAIDEEPTTETVDEEEKTPAIDEEPTTETVDEEEKMPAIDEEPTTETVDEEEKNEEVHASAPKSLMDLVNHPAGVQENKLTSLRDLVNAKKEHSDVKTTESDVTKTEEQKSKTPEFSTPFMNSTSSFKRKNRNIAIAVIILVILVIIIGVATCSKGENDRISNVSGDTRGINQRDNFIGVTSADDNSQEIPALIQAVGNDGQQCSELIDIDGNKYKTVRIGKQCWMKQNLRCKTFADSTAIGLSPRSDVKKPAYYPQSGHGYLYNWYVIARSMPSDSASSYRQSICPDGWHIPDKAEWEQLRRYVSHKYAFSGDTNYIGKPLASRDGWEKSNENNCVGHNSGNNNVTGFSAFPAGIFCQNYNDIGDYANFWSCTEDESGEKAYIIKIGYNSPEAQLFSDYKDVGRSVRCLKNQ